MTLSPNSLILDGRYRIERKLGEGAYGTMYLAQHMQLGRQDAIKVLRRDDVGVGSTVLANYRKRFQLEFRLASQIAHPNVIKVYDLVQHEDKFGVHYTDTLTP